MLLYHDGSVYCLMQTHNLRQTTLTALIQNRRSSSIVLVSVVMQFFYIRGLIVTIVLRVASIPDDLDLLQLAGRDAAAIVETDPTLHKQEHERLRKVLIRQYGDALGLIDVG